MNQDIIELGTLLIICVVIISGVQWFLLRFTHWSVALGATAVISLFLSALYVGYSNATPNGGSRSPDVSEYITPILVIFILLLGGLFLVAYLTRTAMPKLVLLYTTAIIALFLIIKYVHQYIDNATVYQEIFSSCDIKVVNNSDNKLIQEIGFKNSSNSIINSIDPNIEEQPYSNIPRDADQISFRCNSKFRGMFFQDFPFDYSLFQEKDGDQLGLCFWLREKVVLPLKIVVQPNNKVDLYINNHLVKQYQLSSEDLSSVIRNKGKYK